MEIPEDLPQKLLPLAWMIGEWHGYGTMSARFDAAPMNGKHAIASTTKAAAAPQTDEAAADAMIIQRMSVTAVTDSLRVQVTTYAASSETEIPVTADAPQGLKLLKQGEELWQETSTWNIATFRLGTEDEPQPECIADIEVSGSAVAGRWEARSMGPRITARVLRGQDPAIQATRMVGLVGGEFFWAQDRLVPGSVDQDGQAEAATEFSARLARVEKRGE